jgi:hypothetical protein
VVVLMSLLLVVLSAVVPMSLSWLMIGTGSLTLGAIGGLLVGTPSVIAVVVAVRKRDAAVLPGYLMALAASCALSVFVPFIFTFVAATAVVVAAITAVVIRRTRREFTRPNRPPP